VLFCPVYGFGDKQKLKQQASNGAGNEKRITVSIGIPAYNEGRTISQLLNAILKQPTDGFMLKEVVVNASGSNDDTEAKVEAVTRADSKVKLISTGMRSGKAAALNDILQHSKSELVLFLDADVVLEKNSIPSLIAPFLQNEKIGVCSGNTMPVEALKQKGIFEFASLFIRELHHELCSYLMSKGLAPKVNGTFYAFRRGIVDFFPRLVVSDDEYVSWQSQKKGYKIVYVPNASVFTRDPHSFRDFIKWQTRIIAGQFYMKRYFKYDVPTMQMSVAVRGGLFKLLSKHRRKVLSLLTLSLLGAVSFVLAYVKFVRGDVPYVY